MNRLLLLLLFASVPALAQVQVEKPWTRATAPGAQVAGGYMTIRNAGAADKLVSASSPAAAKVELHTHINDNGVMKMREVPGGYVIPAKGSFELKPGGAHLMFMDLKAPFKEGDKVPVKLKFEKAGEVDAEFQVGGMGGSAAPAGHMHMKM
jgi:periplasmic copper chaperone A